MLNDIRVRFGVILAVIALSVWLLVDRGITLGLDLQGGTYLSLQVRDPDNALTSDQKADAIDRALRVIRTRIDELGVAEPAIEKAGQERIVVRLPGATDEEQQRAKEVIQRSAFLQFQIVQPASEIAAALPRIDRAILAAGNPAPAAQAEAGPAAGTPAPATGAPELGLFRTDSTAADSTASDSTVLAAGRDSATADTAAAAATSGDPSQAPFSSRLAPGSAGPEGVFLIANEDAALIERYLALPQVQSLIPRGMDLSWGVDTDSELTGYRSLYLLDEEPLITGEELVDAQAQRDAQLGQPIVLFEFSRRGGREFERGTGQNVGNLMAIVLDDRVFSAPIIQSQIGNRGQIEMGGGTIESASDLALVLRAGALPAPIEIVEERSVGPSLGQDAIDRAQVAGIIGISLIIILMVGYYRFSGLLSILGLACYVLFVLSSLAGVDATLTLPGIAGFVLSIGMAVDANVLIFERIREELAEGKNPRFSVSEGFSAAFSAILDGHVTTLISAFTLYQFGTGPVRGFAVTLAIGLVASLFTAIFITRTFFMLYLDRRAAVAGISI